MKKEFRKLPTEDVSPNSTLPEPPRKSWPRRLISHCDDVTEATQITNDSVLSSTPNLQAFWGIFVPRIQNVLCLSFVVLRLPWMVGVIGLFPSILVICGAAVLLLPTTFSVVALCTSGHEHLCGGPFSILSYSVGDSLAFSITLVFALANIVLSAVHINLATEIFVNSVAIPLKAYFGDDLFKTCLFDDFSNNVRFYALGGLLIVCFLLLLNKKIFQILCFVPLLCVITALGLVCAGIIVNGITGDLEVKGCISGTVLLPKDLYVLKETDGEKSCTCERISNPDNSTNAECYTVKTHFSSQNMTPNLRFTNFLSNTWTTKEYSVFSKKSEFTTSFHFLALLITIFGGHVFDVNISPRVANPKRKVVIPTILAKITVIVIFLLSAIIFGVFVDAILLVDRNGATRATKGRHMTAALLAYGNAHVINGLMIAASLISAAQCARAQKTIVREMLKCKLFDGTVLMHDVHASMSKERSIKKYPMTREMITKYIRIRNGFLTVAETLLLAGFSMIGDADFLTIMSAHLFLFAAAVINIVTGSLRSFRNNSWRPSFRGFLTPIAILAGIVCLFTSALVNTLAPILLGFVFSIISALVFMKPDPVTSLDFVDLMMHCADSMLSASIGKVSKRSKRYLRPRIVIFAHTPGITDSLIRCGKALEQDSGCPSLCMTLIREAPYTPGPAMSKNRTKLGKLEVECSKMGMSTYDLPGHAMFLYYQKISSLQSIIMAATNNAGMGMFKLDTVIINYPTKNIIAATSIRFSYHFEMHRAIRRRANMIVVKGSFFMRRLEVIDVWWILDAGDLLVFLAKQLHRYKKMTEALNAKAKIRLFIVVPETANITESIERRLLKWMLKTRASFHSVEIVKVQLCLIWLYMNKVQERMDFRVAQAVGSAPKGEKSLKRQLKKNYPVQSIVDLSIRERQEASSLSSRARLEAAVVTPNNETCMKLMNKEMLYRSKQADLVILNIPDAPSELNAFEEYLHFIDAQIQGLDNVLLSQSEMSAWFVFCIIPAVCLVIFVFFLAARAASYRVQTRANSPSPIYVARSPQETRVAGGSGVVHNTVPVYTVNQVEAGQGAPTECHGNGNSVQLHAVDESAQANRPDDQPPSYTEVVKTRTNKESDKKNES